MKRLKKAVFRVFSLTLILVMTLILGACGNKEGGATEAVSEKETEKAKEEVTLRIGSLKGPTTMGLVNLMKWSEKGETEGKYSFTMETQADVIAAGVISGDLDIALVPANLAAVLYKKTEGKVKVLYINTMGVLECVTGDESIKSIKDLAGKTVLSTGQGTTPEYVLKYLLKGYGVTDCNIEFKSEATEIASILKEDPKKIAILPQPFATVAQVQNDAVKKAFSLTDAWDQLDVDSELITGVTIVRSEILEKYPDAVDQFMKEAVKSAGRGKTDEDATAELIAEYGIIEKAPIAKKALPECNIVTISGSEMKRIVSGYLQVLFDQDPKSVGGAMPQEDFYFSN